MHRAGFIPDYLFNIMKIAVSVAALDELARAQFLEGVARIPFGKVSGKASAHSAIRKILVVISGDPTTDPDTAKWAKQWISTGSMYNRTWEAVQRVLSKTSVSPDEVFQKSVMVGIETKKGNYFYKAGMAFTPESIVSGDASVGDATSVATKLAVNGARNFLKSDIRRKRKEDMAADRGDIGVITPRNWDTFIEYMYANPTEELSKEFFRWMRETAESNPEMTPYEKSVLLPYLDMVASGNAPSDADYAKSIGMKSPPQFSKIKKDFRDYTYLMFRNVQPDFLRDPEDEIFLMNVALGKVAKKRANAGRSDVPF